MEQHFSPTDQSMVTFIIAGDTDFTLSRPETFFSLPAEDARDLLAWIGYERDVWGALEARDCAARCRRRLWPISRNLDAAREEGCTTVQGRKVVVRARPAGYLLAKTEELLTFCERAGDQHLLFS